MKTKLRSMMSWAVAASTMWLMVSSPEAVADPFLINTFDDEDEVFDNNGTPWDNWFGSAFFQVLWESDDASNDVSSGSMRIEAIYPPGGGQFVVYNQNDGISPPLDGNGSAVAGPVATNLQFDIRFDPITITDGGNFPTLEVGTRGTGFGQSPFGTVTIPATQTNWVHINLPIGPNPVWETIPNLFFKRWSGEGNDDWVVFNVDNIFFDLSVVEIDPPEMAIEEATPALRVFAGSTANTYDREQLTSVDTNQSWVGGTYPVSYSFELLSFPTTPPPGEETVFRYHIFLVPVANAGGNSFANNQFIEYQAGDNLWLNINQTSDTNGVVTLDADVSWKTNLPNANPDNEVLRITNDTAVGTWALTFDSATAGTLTAPGASPAAFSIPADVAARFANPLVAFFGVQPDSGWGIGQHTDVGSIQTIGVASPGVAISQDFTTATSIDTNVWDLSNSALEESLVLVSNDSSWWVNWAFPDAGFGLSTKADIGATNIAWKTPNYYTGNVSNNIYQQQLGTDRVWSLIPAEGLPTTDGTSNGVVGASAFFRLEKPAPAE